MKAEGIDVISFGAGEPDFNTPQPICDAAKEAIDSGFTKYTPSAGINELREAICGKLSRENGLQYYPSQVIVSCGAKHSVYNSMQVLIDPGDEVILIAPYWMTYADQIQLAGGIPVVVKAPAETGFVPDIEQIREVITPKTKAILINSPSNPSGAVLPDNILKGIADIADQHDLWIISDEIYERLIYGTSFRSIASFSQNTKDRTITIGGCSKSYAMTGWRIGFAAAPLPVAKAMSNFQDQVTSNPTSFAQRGAVVAFNLPSESVEAMRAEFEIRRDLIVGLLADIPGVKINPPKGAFYAFPDITNCLLPGESDLDLAAFLLEKAHVAVVPGSVFEGPGHIRLSYATSRQNIEEGVRRIKDAFASRQ
jgi:aspartate aminotransferase